MNIINLISIIFIILKYLNLLTEGGLGGTITV